MRNWLSYIIGIVTGIALTILVSLFIAKSSDNGVTMFPEAGDCISEKPFNVLQVIEPGAALANEESYDGMGMSMYTGMVVLFLNDDGKSYYDDQIIEIPYGKCARQIGTYRYSTNVGYKTVPIVKITEK